MRLIRYISIAFFTVVLTQAAFAAPHKNVERVAKSTLAGVKAQAKIDINTASAAELETLHHIGPKKAAAIIAYRKAHGDFKSVQDLTKVKGIDVKIIQFNAKRLSLG